MEIVIPTWAVYIIVALLGVLGAFAVQRYVAFRNASVKFRAAVLTALSGLYPHPANWPRDSVAIDAILKKEFPSMQAAVREFRDVLPWWRRRAFDAAWLHYCCSTGRECDKNTYHHYMPMHSPGEQPPDVKAMFHDNVSKLLSFANET